AVGKIPFINSFAAFSPGRNWDQLRVSVCYSNLNVKVHASHAGITVGEDGATHQALEDIAITRVLPNLTVIVPADANEAKNATLAIAKHEGPVYLRTSRAKVPQITKKEPFVIGKAKKMSSGTDVTIVACGVMVNEALKAKEILDKKKISVEILNTASIKPFDEKALLTSIKKTGCIVTAEEHQIHGGLGSLVAEIITKNDTLVPIEMVGMQDCFGESGTADQLLAKYEMDSHAIVKAVKKVLKRKK
ncbi:MAG: transketolase family protein, partial [bacterium]